MPRPRGATRSARGPGPTAGPSRNVERLVEAGELESYSVAADTLGLTRARLTQVMGLLLLAPEIQERILTGDLRASERALRRAVGESAWEQQKKVVPLPA